LLLFLLTEIHVIVFKTSKYFASFLFLTRFHLICIQTRSSSNDPPFGIDGSGQPDQPDPDLSGRGTGFTTGKQLGDKDSNPIPEKASSKVRIKIFMILLDWKSELYHDLFSFRPVHL
jgi:hypothetical protein